MVAISVYADLKREGALHVGNDLVRRFGDDKTPPLKQKALDNSYKQRNARRITSGSTKTPLQRRQMVREDEQNSNMSEMLNKIQKIMEPTNNAKSDEKFNNEHELSQNEVLRLLSNFFKTL